MVMHALYNTWTKKKNTGSVGNVVNTNFWKYTTENLIHRFSSHKKLEYSHATFHDMWNNIFFFNLQSIFWAQITIAYTREGNEARDMATSLDK